MGNPMTPYFPPVVPFVPITLTITVSNIENTTFTLSDQQLKSQIIRVTGLASGTGTYAIYFPQNQLSSRSYYFLNNFTGTGNVYAASYTGGSPAHTLYTGLVQGLVFNASGGVNAIQRSNATNVPYV